MSTLYVPFLILSRDTNRTQLRFVSWQPSLFVVGVARGPYNWLTQSSLDTFADFPASVSQSQSSLLFTIGRKPAPAGSKRRLKALGPDFGRGRLGDGGTDGVDSRQGKYTGCRRCKWGNEEGVMESMKWKDIYVC